MNICLVMPLAVSDFVDADTTINAQPKCTAPHLGILTLAAILRRHGIGVSVLNLNELFVSFAYHAHSEKLAEKSYNAVIRRTIEAMVPSAGAGTFLDFVCEQLEQRTYDVLGIGSICSSYPLSVRIAERAKAARPGIPIIFGGPQASVVDTQTLDAFGFVDFVLRGEADDSLPALLSALSGRGGELESVAGLSWRHHGLARRGQPAPLVELDDLPLPAFDLDPYVRERRTLSMEMGRGCPFACTFCSTNDFFRRNFRLKSTGKLLAEMQFVEATYGIKHFDFVHDMYTVNRRKVVEFCEALLNGGHDYVWGCSARTDCVDDRLIALMADAGCKGMFFGIETGSARMQQVIQKKLDLAEATMRIAATDRFGIRSAVAMIMGFPEETRDDLRDTLHFFINSSRFDHADPQVSLLAPLAETPIETEFRDRLVLDDFFSSMSFQGWQWNDGDLDLVKAHPRIFSNFYAIPTQWVARPYLAAVHDFMIAITRHFRWLTLGLVRDSGDFLAVFDLWQARRPPKREDDASDPAYVPYHCRAAFRHDFLAFVSKDYLPLAKNRAVVEALLINERTVLDLLAEYDEDAGKRDAGPQSITLTLETVPRRSRHMRVVHFDVDFDELQACLRSEKPLSAVSERPVAVCYRTLARNEVEIRQLSPLSAALLDVCDGDRAVNQMISHPQWRRNLHGAAVPEKITMLGLQRLYEQSLLVA